MGTFVTSKEAIAHARLTKAHEVPTDLDQVVERAETHAYLLLHQYLGASKIASLLLTTDPVKQEAARLLELEFIVMQLYQTLPLLVQEAGAAAHQLWNQTPGFRNSSSASRSRLMAESWARVDRMLKFLGAEDKSAFSV
jgi:hypothetical protein